MRTTVDFRKLPDWVQEKLLTYPPDHLVQLTGTLSAIYRGEGQAELICTIDGIKPSLAMLR